MQYFSLNKNAPIVGFKQATINGQAPDKGLYFPLNLPKHPKHLGENLNKLSNHEIAYKIIKPYIGNDIPDNILKDIVAQTINFEIPLIPIDDAQTIFSLELFHGPTLAFKDVGARFMSRCLGYFAKDFDKKITVLVATSGDTGGAVANGFYNVDGVEVVILYPKGKVSSIQEKQLTTYGGNVKAIEVKGNFDDCQKMVKEAFVDKEIKEKLFLTSANSINVARWLPQQFYYAIAFKQWLFDVPPIICVPSGNFGNICAGILLAKTGFTECQFLAATNINDTVPRFFENQKYQPQKAVPTISNAMDVADPSNFVRILEIFENKFKNLHQYVSSLSVNDEETKYTLIDVYNKYKYLLDPHGAVAYHAIEKYLKKNKKQRGIILETAHPIKFLDVVEPLINKKIEIPQSIKDIMNKPKNTTEIENDYNSLKSVLLD